MVRMTEEHLKRSYKAVVIGGSAGSFQVITKILSRIPADFPLPIIIACHRLKHIRSGFVEALEIKSVKKIEEPEDKQAIRKGCVYIAPANYHMSVEIGNTIALSTEDMLWNSRPSIDFTLESAAYVWREKVLGILLTGANRDGALGMKRIHDKGGITIVQEPSECTIDTMPKAALAITTIDYIMRVEEIIETLNAIHKLTKGV